MRDFTYDKTPQCHIERRREIILKYPEIRAYFTNEPWSFAAIFAIVLVQLIFSFLLKESSWGYVLIAAYFVGAFFHHGLYVMIHEATHNLIFKSKFLNKLSGLFCDVPLVIPSAMGFRKYHMIHHKHLGEYHYDPDIVSRLEGHLVGNSWLNKSLWLFFFSISQGLRPLKVRYYRPLNAWTALNLFWNLFINFCLFYFWGPKALAYLALSTLFALGLHPLGGRWIQEHFITKEGQETYSYYGPLNFVTFNMGYHNEHHDFMNVPWNHLPKIKSIAPEYYLPLKSYSSWTKVLLHFIFDPKMDSFSRIIHPDQTPNNQNESLRPSSNEIML